MRRCSFSCVSVALVYLCAFGSLDSSGTVFATSLGSGTDTLSLASVDAKFDHLGRQSMQHFLTSVYATGLLLGLDVDFPKSSFQSGLTMGAHGPFFKFFHNISVPDGVLSGALHDAEHLMGRVLAPHFTTESAIGVQYTEAVYRAENALFRSAKLNAGAHPRTPFTYSVSAGGGFGVQFYCGDYLIASRGGGGGFGLSTGGLGGGLGGGLQLYWPTFSTPVYDDGGGGGFGTQTDHSAEEGQQSGPAQAANHGAPPPATWAENQRWGGHPGYSVQTSYDLASLCTTVSRLLVRCQLEKRADMLNTLSPACIGSDTATDVLEALCADPDEVPAAAVPSVFVTALREGPCKRLPMWLVGGGGGGLSATLCSRQQQKTPKATAAVCGDYEASFGFNVSAPVW